MKKVGFIGCGWRSETYFRIIKSLPEEFTISGIFCHTQKSVEKMDRMGLGPVFTDLEAFLNEAHDFVFMLIPRKENVSYLEKVLAKGFPVLMETPPAGNLEELIKVYELKQQYHGKIQVAEQYFLQPYHQAVQTLVKNDVIGEVSNLRIAMMHDYHGISVMRKLLGADRDMAATVTGHGYEFPVQYHAGREGLHIGSETIRKDHRKVAEFTFANGTVGFFDFADEQYFNYFRSRHINVQGLKGEIDDYDVAYLNEKGRPVRTHLMRQDFGLDSNLEGYQHQGMLFNGEMIYENPVEARLADDEISMAMILRGMAAYVDGGEEIYPIEDGLQDMYLTLVMDEAIATGKAVTTEKQIWNQ